MPRGDVKTYAGGEDGAAADTVADIVSGRLYEQTDCGMAAVANTGNDAMPRGDV